MSKLLSFVDIVGRHKSLVVIFITALFVCFIDANSLWERHYRWQRIDEMKAEIAKLQREYDENTRQLELLKTSPARVEQIARERYYMTRQNEDLFIIQHGNSTPVGHVVSQEDDGDEPEV